MWALEQYQVFSEFLLAKHDAVLACPIEGALVKVCIMYKQYVGVLNQKAIIGAMMADFDSKFRQYVDGYNEVSGGGVEIVGGRIVDINKMKVHILQQAIKGEGKPVKFGKMGEAKGGESGSPKEKLLRMLDNECHSGIRPIEPKNGVLKSVDIYTTKKDLIALLDSPTCTTTLVRKRAQIATIKKPFYEDCDNKNHIRVLSNVCFKRRDTLSQGPSRQSFPSLEECFSAIEQSRKLFAKGIYECSKSKIHYLPVISSSTDTSLGDCSYLDTCHKIKTCRYLHYFTLTPPVSKQFSVKKEMALIRSKLIGQEYTVGYCYNEFIKPSLPAQWINCDIRELPFSVLGKFAAIISDPAWDIHMSLPYGTCSDEQLINLPMHELQDEGIMMLWVTGRSIEIGRKALIKWGYCITDEIIWIKLNQLKRTIVTGRTGHWLNHSKEHLLVGLKGNPLWASKLVDINTIVSATRETSRKPDEVYDIVERITGKHHRKLEIFGRDHNIRPGWFTIGNQITGTSIVEREVLEKWEEYERKR